MDGTNWVFADEGLIMLQCLIVDGGIFCGQGNHGLVEAMHLTSLEISE